jgi:type IV secretory pathway VirB2 component (pilin)
MNEDIKKDETIKHEAHANVATGIGDASEEESLFSGSEFSKMSNVVLAGIMGGSAFSCAVLLVAVIVAAALFGMSQGLLWCVSIVVVGVSCGILQQLLFNWKPAILRFSYPARLAIFGIAYYVILAILAVSCHWFDATLGRMLVFTLNYLVIFAIMTLIFWLVFRDREREYAKRLAEHRARNHK